MGGWICWVRRVSPNGVTFGDWFISGIRDQDSGLISETTRPEAEETARLHRIDGFQAVVLAAGVDP